MRGISRPPTTTAIGRRRRQTARRSCRSMFVIRLPKRSTRTTSPVNSVAGHHRPRQIDRLEVLDALAERHQRDPLGEEPGRRRESIAALEGAADGRPRVLALGQLDDLLRRRLAKHRREHAVVRRHESIVADVGGDAAARRSDARIDDDEEDRAVRKIAIARGELERAGEHVVRGNVVADVDERRIGAHARAPRP